MTPAERAAFERGLEMAAKLCEEEQRSCRSLWDDRDEHRVADAFWRGGTNAASYLARAIRQLVSAEQGA